MPLGNAEADLILQSALRLSITTSHCVSSSQRSWKISSSSGSSSPILYTKRPSGGCGERDDAACPRLAVAAPRYGCEGRAGRLAAGLFTEPSRKLDS
jgi:hypothetical protein